MADRSTTFRNSTGKLRTRALFLEFNTDQPEEAIYSVKRQDQGKVRSLFLLYIQEKDVTEYRFAVKYFDSFAHWQAICQTSWFSPIIEEWRAELQALLKSEAFRRIVEAAESQGQNNLRANEYILERKWEKATKGRPSKEQVEKAATKIATVNKKLQEDMARLDIVPVPEIPSYDLPSSDNPLDLE